MRIVCSFVSALVKDRTKILSKWLRTSLLSALWIMAAIEPYYFEQNMLQLTMMKIVSSIDDSEVDNVLGKKIG